MNENFTMRERMSGAINALSISPEGNSVVVAGRESKRKKTTDQVEIFILNFPFSFESS